MKIIIAPALLVIGLLFAGSCRTKPLEYVGFDNPQLVKLGFPHSTLSMDVRCFNPNHYGMKVNSLQSDIFINDKYLGKARLDSTLSVPRQDTFQLPLMLDVEVGPTLTGLMKLLQGKPGDSIRVKVKLEGKARMEKAGVGFTYPTHYENMQSLKF